MSVIAATRSPSDDRLHFSMMFAGFLALYAICWTTEYSFDLWVFKDRGNFLNFAYLLDKGFRIGVDTYYLYGLLPVLLQDVLFKLFGRGAWPLIACHFMHLALMAAAFTVIVRHTAQPTRWMLGAIALSPIIIWVCPNISYVLVQISMVWALACVLERRYRLALVIAAFGCWSVPSLSLVTFGCIGLLLLAHWWLEGERKFGRLLKLVGPGVAMYLALGLLFCVYFGVASTLATALPLQGASFYEAVDYGVFTSLKIFLYPGVSESRPNWSAARYYVFDRATWWVFSTLLLTALGAFNAWKLLRRPADASGIDPKSAFVVICAFLHWVFILVAYGTPPQHIIYDFLLVAGTLIGLSALRHSRPRSGLIAIFFTLGVFSFGNQASTALWQWRVMAKTPESAGFYAHEDFVKEWTEVVERSKSNRLFLLSYATGVHHYFPTIINADSWLIQWGQMLPPDKERLMAKLATAEVVVEDLTGILSVFDRDEDIRRELASLCLVKAEKYFITWRRSPDPATGECKTYLRELPKDIRERGENAV